ncbi:MAG: hypothetical protein MRY72_02915 [Aquisalinus sp.]|nr:hypothetical protein [Aquisalinus sp.]
MGEASRVHEAESAMHQALVNASHMLFIVGIDTQVRLFGANAPERD